MIALLRARLSQTSWPLAYRLLLSAAFVVVLLYPLGRAPLGISAYLFEPTGEWRTPAEIDRAFREHFPLRGRARRIMAMLPFGTLPGNVVRGKQDWLFYDADASGDGQVMEDLAGRVTPSPADLDKWRDLLLRRRAEVAAGGGLYLAMVAPNKETIYADRLPLRYRTAKPQLTRMDRVGEALPKDLLLDLRPVLHQARRDAAPHDVYFATDTHWNPLGAMAAYRVVIDQLRARFPAMTPLTDADVRVVAQDRVGDLTHMAGRTRTEATITLSPRASLPARWGETGLALLTPDGETRCLTMDAQVTSVQDRDDLPTAVVFHDSFMVFLAPYLAQNFRRVRYVWGRYDPELIAREKPDVVLHETVERYLGTFFQAP
jgi:hypothetical protein